MSLVAAGLLLMLMGTYICSSPLVAEAKGKPEVTGQEKAASMSGKASSSDEDATSTDEDNGKARGLERAANAGKKPEEIRNQLRFILMLITQMKTALNGGGIGKELSEFIHNGRQLPDGDGNGSSTPSILSAELISAVETLNENDASSTEDNVGEFELEFTVAASTTDLSIPTGVGMNSGSSTGVVYSIRNASGTVVDTGSVTDSLSSSATTSGSNYVVADGESETFTLTVSFDPVMAGMYYVQLESLRANNEVFEFTPAADFQSDQLDI